MIEQSALTIIPVFNVGAINADTSAVQGICLLACLRVYVCMGVNWRKRGEEEEEEEVSTQREFIHPISLSDHEHVLSCFYKRAT